MVGLHVCAPARDGDDQALLYLLYLRSLNERRQRKARRSSVAIGGRESPAEKTGVQIFVDSEGQIFAQMVNCIGAGQSVSAHNGEHSKVLWIRVL